MTNADATSITDALVATTYVHLLPGNLHRGAFTISFNTVWEIDSAISFNSVCELGPDEHCQADAQRQESGEQGDAVVSSVLGTDNRRALPCQSH